MNSENSFAEVTLSTDPTTPARVHYRLYLWHIVGLYLVLGATLAVLLSLFVPFLPVAVYVGGLTTAILGPTNQYWVIRKEWKKRLKHPITYSFSEEGIRARTEGIDSQVGWQRIRKVRQILDQWLLFYSDQEYMLIPIDQLGPSRTLLLDILLRNGIKGASALDS